MITKKIYHDDSYQKEFQAKVVSQKKTNNGLEVELDQTCFYATAGGQPNDRGTIDGIPVMDVFAEGEQIFHRLDASEFQGRDVFGRIDWTRRYDHMQQHTGQHLLTEVFIRLADAPTLSFHLGEDYCTIDLPTISLEPALTKSVEDKCADLIRENLAVTIHHLDHTELDRFPLRKMPPDVDRIRIIEIDGFDYSPCGGTHVQRLGELLLIKIIGVEKVKQGIRVKFLAGNRALADYQAKHHVLMNVSEQMTCAWPEVPEIWQKNVDERKSDRKTIKSLRTKLFDYHARDLLVDAEIRTGIKIVTAIVDDAEMEDLSQIARTLVSSQDPIVAFLMGKSARASIVFARTESAPGNMNDLLKSICDMLGGRGGGQPHFAQGSAAASNNADQALQTARDMLLCQITE